MSILEKLGIRRSGRAPDHQRWRDSKNRVISVGDTVRSTKGWQGRVKEISYRGILVNDDEGYDRLVERSDAPWTTLTVL